MLSQPLRWLPSPLEGPRQPWAKSHNSLHIQPPTAPAKCDIDLTANAMVPPELLWGKAPGPPCATTEILFVTDMILTTPAMIQACPVQRRHLSLGSPSSFWGLCHWLTLWSWTSPFPSLDSVSSSVKRGPELRALPVLPSWKVHRSLLADFRRWPYWNTETPFFQKEWGEAVRFSIYSY